ncbi:uncharacterized protein LOC122265444 [Penaeus japonicus]|uniref:uncharacterized protein LOC122265444 n=1 Tax=Penaeus japonicus TaxID=27405 RepID=UPI001C710ADA|nr:uncharacterized protein LOC122265444 [Penaeus japonicus]
MPHSDYVEDHEWWSAFVMLEEKYTEAKCESRKYQVKKKLGISRKFGGTANKRAGPLPTTEGYSMSSTGSTEESSMSSTGSTEESSMSSTGSTEESSMSSTGSTEESSMSSTGSTEGPSMSSTGSTEGPSMSSTGSTEGPSMSSTGSTEGPSMSSTGSTEGPSMSSSGSTEGPSMSSSGSTEGPSMSSSGSTEGPSMSSSGGTEGPSMSSSGSTVWAEENYEYEEGSDGCDTSAKCNTTCNGYFCSVGYCIPKYWLCDEYNDCPSGEDELGCDSCSYGSFRCSSGKCIPNAWVCDGSMDCSDAADELICDVEKWLVCPRGFFNCTETCIREMYRCDGEGDCPNAEDEVDCDECQKEAYQCQGGGCVAVPRLCDGVRNCPQGDDEDNCPVKNSTALCPPGYLSCDNGTCYNGRFRCDGKALCLDGTDEYYCYSEFVTPEVHEMRLSCSEYYRNLVNYLGIEGLPNISPSESQRECQPFGNGSYREISFWSPVCLISVVCDFYGCYSADLERYTEFVEKRQLCSKCGDTSTNCWLPKWIDEYEGGKLTNDSLDLMLKKGIIPDFSDVADLYAPSRDERLNNSISAEDIVYSCTFNKRQCDHTHFYTWMSDEYGTCYTFNSFFQGNESDLRVTKKAGPKSGLKVTLNIRKGVALLTPEVGVRVIVHDPRLLPALEEEGFTVGPGVSSVAIMRTKYQRLGKPHGICTDEYNFDHPYTYSRKLCKQLCIERVYRERCGCFVGQNPLYDWLDEKPIKRCSSTDLVQGMCMGAIEKSLEEEQIECDCPLPCSEMKYSAQVTASMANEMYYNILSQTRKELQSLCTDDSQMVSLLLYLDSMNYAVTEESPAYSWDTLLSNIGGSLGLFVGVSLISLLEMMEMFIDMIIIAYRRCTGIKRISQTSPSVAWTGKMERVERQMSQQGNEYHQLRKELEMIKDIVQDLKQNQDDSLASIRVQPNGAALTDRGGTEASRMFNLLFMKNE